MGNDAECNSAPQKERLSVLSRCLANPPYIAVKASMLQEFGHFLPDVLDIIRLASEAIT